MHQPIRIQICRFYMKYQKIKSSETIFSIQLVKYAICMEANCRKSLSIVTATAIQIIQDAVYWSKFIKYYVVLDAFGKMKCIHIFPLRSIHHPLVSVLTKNENKCERFFTVFLIFSLVWLFKVNMYRNFSTFMWYVHSMNNWHLY